MGRTILIVDDEPAVRRGFADLIRTCGYSVIEAESAEEALVFARSTRIDGYVLDIGLPGMSGVNLCRMIRQIDDLVPVIFVTGAEVSAAEAFEAGCDDLMAKPTDPLVFQARLKGHMERVEHSYQLRRTRELLNHYLSKRTREVAEMAAITGLLPSPEQREVVIMFTDIRGFTALSEEMAPDHLFSVLSAQLAVQVHQVYEHNGYVDKFGGDGLMAVFDGPEMALQSCLCALRIIDDARHSQGDAGIHQLGIGLHMGQVVIGNIGSIEHLDYSVIGNAVNLAARLCGQALPMTIVASEAVRNAATGDPRLQFDSKRQVPIRGLKEPVTVFALSAPATQRVSEFSTGDRAVSAGPE